MVKSVGMPMLLFWYVNIAVQKKLACFNEYLKSWTRIWKRLRFYSPIWHGSFLNDFGLSLTLSIDYLIRFIVCMWNREKKNNVRHLSLGVEEERKSKINKLHHFGVDSGHFDMKNYSTFFQHCSRDRVDISLKHTLTIPFHDHYVAPLFK